jgi:molybdopterin-guanine dinucleotide biosynthesis protein A
MLYPKNRIIILSDAIRTGKTTALSNWLATVQSKAGFICPDRDKTRKLLNLQTGFYHNFEVTGSVEDSISIGKFHFSKKVIKLACDSVLEALHRPFQFLVLDEIGKLEIELEQGFYPILNQIIATYQQPGNGHLILVIRDTLLQKGIEKFQLQSAKILNLQEFIAATQTHGLVLAGGNSSRMGTSKALINYHQQAQHDYLYQNLKEHCKHVFLSLKTNTATTNPNQVPCLLDDADYSEMGPMNGLISAFNHNPLCNWLLLACDYPFLKSTDIATLFKHSQNVNTSICYGTDNNYEPLLAVYQLNNYMLFWEMLQNGNQSLRKFQERMQAKIIQPSSNDILFSADTPKDKMEAIEKL